MQPVEGDKPKGSAKAKPEAAKSPEDGSKVEI